MKIRETKMEKNQYSKKDAEDWLMYPECSEKPQTTYVCVNNLVLYSEDLFEKLDKDSFDNKNPAKYLIHFNF